MSIDSQHIRKYLSTFYKLGLWWIRPRSTHQGNFDDTWNEEIMMMMIKLKEKAIKIKQLEVPVE